MTDTRIFCRSCAHPLVRTIPTGDTLERNECPECGYIEYETPTAVVSTLLVSQKKILFVRRAVEPYAGKWAPPGGYPEKGESMRAAAVREVNEETGIVIEQNQLIPFFLSSITSTNQYYISFRAHVDECYEPECSIETSAGAWFSRSDFDPENYWLPALASTMMEVFDCVEADEFKLYVADVTENRFAGDAFDIDPNNRRTAP